MNLIFYLLNLLLGSPYTLIIVFSVILAVASSRARALESFARILLIMALSIEVLIVLKNIFAIPLPVKTPIGFDDAIWAQRRLETFSFPSTHVGFSLAMLSSGCVEILKHLQRKSTKVILVILCGCIGILNSYRIWYCGFHHMIDIVAALMIVAGMIWMLYAQNVFRYKSTFRFLPWLLLPVLFVSCWYRNVLFPMNILKILFGLFVLEFKIGFNR